MPERIFKIKRSYLWLGLLYPLFFLQPLIGILKPAGTDAYMLLGLLLIALAAFSVFLSGLLFQDLVLTDNALRWRRILFPKTVREVPLEQILRVELRQAGRNRQLSVTTRDRKQRMIQGALYHDFDALVSALGERTASDTQPVTPDIPLMQDIGNRPLHLIVVAVGLFIAGLTIDKFLVKAWHCSSENMFGWMGVAAPLGMAICYAYIRGERKGQPVAAAVLTGLLLGGALDLDFLIANRLMTEASAQTSYQTFRLLEQEDYRQKWEPMDPKALVFHDPYFHVANVWKEGYNPDLKVGGTYRVAVMKGAFNDIAFPVGAFREAVGVE